MSVGTVSISLIGDKVAKWIGSDQLVWSAATLIGIAFTRHYHGQFSGNYDVLYVSVWLCRRCCCFNFQHCNRNCCRAARSQSLYRSEHCCWCCDGYRPSLSRSHCQIATRLAGDCVFATDCCGLTEREREAAILIVHGKSNREIAEAMTIGVKTVETYVTRILNKLGFDSRVQIATWAMEKGLK